jgi:hypothetical protein
MQTEQRCDRGRCRAVWHEAWVESRDRDDDNSNDTWDGERERRAVGWATSRTACKH